MSELFSDTTMQSLELALRGAAERQRTTAHNIANVNTPGFRSSRVSFEKELASALSRGEDIGGVEIGRERANTPVNARGNDVALEEESQDLITAGVQYEALVNALNFKLGALRTAIRGA
jgi:flagellar basal-body rod protein FlgB